MSQPVDVEEVKNVEPQPSSSDKTFMKSNGLKCEINTPKAWKHTQRGLPPHRRRPAFLVDEYPAAPKNWMRSEGITTSYIVPVKEGEAMWLDFNGSCHHTHHVAALISVQGVNPITGRPFEERMEQYVEKCPVHDISFGPDRHCSKCEFKWPAQNYISSNVHDQGDFWLDGFRLSGDKISQYILTAKEMMGVASHIVGNDRVFAIGVTFFVSKAERPKRQRITRNYYAAGAMGNKCTAGDPGWPGKLMHYADYYKADIDSKHEPMMLGGMTRSMVKGQVDPSEAVYCASIGDYETVVTDTRPRPKEVEVEQLEVGRGVEINQSVQQDTFSLDDWRDDPFARIVINYASENEVIQILRSKMPLKIKNDGAFEGIPSTHV